LFVQREGGKEGGKEGGREGGRMLRLKNVPCIQVIASIFVIPANMRPVRRARAAERAQIALAKASSAPPGERVPWNSGSVHIVDRVATVTTCSMFLTISIFVANGSWARHSHHKVEKQASLYLDGMEGGREGGREGGKKNEHTYEPNPNPSPPSLPPSLPPSSPSTISPLSGLDRASSLPIDALLSFFFSPPSLPPSLARQFPL
jgi:hypothetical protein